MEMCMVFYLTFSEADSKPSIQYFRCKIRKFKHLHYFNKRITEWKKRRMEKKNNSNDQKNGFVIIGVIGEFTAEDLLLFPKGNVGSFLKKKKLIENLYCYMCHY